MVFLFWSCTIGLLLLAVGVIFPWISRIKIAFSIFVAIGIVAYSLYFFLGSSQHLKAYYSINQEQRARMQPLVTELKKQEYRLRFYLEEHPNDSLAHSQLLEILGIQALQVGNQDLAKRFLTEALNKVNEKEFPNRKQHLQGILTNLD